MSSAKSCRWHLAFWLPLAYLDGMEILTAGITVTAQDITSGQRCKSHECPVALAASRVFDAYVAVGVNRLSVYFGDGLAAHYALPRAAMRWIDEFDSETGSRQYIQPFSFVAVREDIQ